MNPGADAGPGAGRGADAGADSGADPGSEPGADAGADPGADPGSDPGARADPGADAGGHRRRIERAFTVQAGAFEDPRANRVLTAGAEWLFDRVPRSADDLVLDVAAGTGHAARRLAPSVRAVIAVDATPAMLAAGRASARREGHRNIVFMRGDAGALPFLDGAFDIVVCRFALHHFPSAEPALAEMRRCLRSGGGRLAIGDLVADPDPAIAGAQNELERLRDPSHTRMLSPPELSDLVARHTGSPADLELRSLRRPLTPWLEQAGAPAQAAAAIRARLEAELDGGPRSGFEPARIGGGGELSFQQTFASCWAVVE